MNGTFGRNTKLEFDFQDKFGMLQSSLRNVEAYDISLHSINENSLGLKTEDVLDQKQSFINLKEKTSTQRESNHHFKDLSAKVKLHEEKNQKRIADTALDDMKENIFLPNG